MKPMHDGNDDGSGDDDDGDDDHDSNNVHALCLVNTQYVFMLTTFIALIHSTNYIPLSLIKTLIATFRSLSHTHCLSVSHTRPLL